MIPSEKLRRKQIVRAIRAEQRLQFEKDLPMSKELLRKMFRSLERQLKKYGCDHTLLHTRKFFIRNKLDYDEAVEQWFGAHGGFCDCEILANLASDCIDENIFL